MDVSVLIYFYIFICIALLVFNIAYILRSKGKKRAKTRRTRAWLEIIQTECQQLEQDCSSSSDHQRKLERKLRSVEQLTDYHAAVLQALEQNPELTQRYLDTCLPTFQTLAVAYGKRPAMERAFYAHIISIYRPAPDKQGGQLSEILLNYFENSTVFCRENVLQALYALGRPGAIEQSFSLLSSRELYHNPRLLSDGLALYSGDQEDLARRLWQRCRGWTEPFQIAVVQFATGLSASFAEEFLTTLQQNDTLSETRFALVRYFQRHVYNPAYPVLLDLLTCESEEGGLAIAAASALSRYPGKETTNALLRAVQSRNWYVRQNAAASLVALGYTWSDAQTLRESGDRYAAEMLEYTLEIHSPPAHTDREQKVAVGGSV